MSLTVTLLFLSGFVSLTTSASNETLCEALEQHRYSDMGLLSFSSYRNGKGLLIFTQPGYCYYAVHHEKITFASMDLSQVNQYNMANQSGYEEAFSPVLEQTPRGTYFFYLFHIWQWAQNKQMLLILIVTDKGTQTGSYHGNADDFTEVTLSDGRALPDFTLAGIGWDWSSHLSGYVLSADVDRFPGFIILSQYKVMAQGSKVTGLPLPAGQTDDRPVWFLQVIDHPFEMFLVHSSNKPDPDAQMLRSVPRSFLFDKKHLVLFDTVNGCVHIIHDFQGFDVTGTQSRVFKRSNYPFEVYFKCGTHALDNPKPNRCNVVRGSHRPTGVTPENPVTPSTESVDSFSLGTTRTVCLLVVAVLAGGLIYAIMVKKKGKGSKGRSAGKSSASSSAINGKSKTGSKRSTIGNSSISGHDVKSRSTSKVAKNRQASKTFTSK